MRKRSRFTLGVECFDVFGLLFGTRVDVIRRVQLDTDNEITRDGVRGADGRDNPMQEAERRFLCGILVLTEVCL